MTKTDPASQDDFNTKYMAAHKVTGYGAEVATHFPCPFCAAPGFQVAPILDVQGAIAKEATCKACGRSGKWVYYPTPAGSSAFTFVQTGGEDPPAWMEPKPRRE